jgi:hypothetical protein
VSSDPDLQPSKAIFPDLLSQTALAWTKEAPQVLRESGGSFFRLLKMDASSARLSSLD